MNCFHYTPGYLSLSRKNLSWHKNNFHSFPHISLLSTLALLKNWGIVFLPAAPRPAFSSNHTPQSVGRKLTTLRERTVRIRKDAHRPTMAGPQFWREIPPRFTKIENFKNPLFVPKNGKKVAKWARSSAGRAFGSHPRGRRFDPVRVHHFEKNHRQFGGDFSFNHNSTTDRPDF